MSGLFSYHIRCPSCDLVSPTVHLGSYQGDDELVRLVADPETGDFAVVPGSGAGLADGRIELTPPVPCPRCGASIATGELGDPPASQREWLDWDQVVRDTRDAPLRILVRFVASDGSHLQCVRPRKERREWFLFRAAVPEQTGADLAALEAALAAVGSRCTDQKVGRRSASLTEWPTG